MYSKKYWDMIVRYLSYEATQEEINEIEHKVKNDTEFALFFREIENMLFFDEEYQPAKSADEKWEEMKSDLLKSYDKKIYKLSEQSSHSGARRVKKTIYWQVLRYAAVLLLAVGLPYLSYNAYFAESAQQSDNMFRVIKVPYSERMSVTLSDGSIVRLDAGSELRIPSNFNEDRNVYLAGEAYFKVVHDAGRPFRVYANGALVRVLGTEFNVRAWAEAEKVTVTLRRGQVAFSSIENESSPTVILTKGKQSVLSANGIPSEPVAVNVDDYTSWVNNELYFKNASLREVLSQLERWYGYHFIVDDTLLYSNRLTYHIKKSNVKNLLQSISIITNTKVVRHGNEIQLIEGNDN